MFSSFGKIRVKTKSKEEQNASDKRVVWTTEKVNEAKQRIEDGYQIKNSPFWENKFLKYRRGNITFHYTEWELNEIKKCKRDVVYFVETYVKFKTDFGYKTVTLYPYQYTMLTNYHKKRFNVVLSSRQVGKTTTAAAFIIWFVCFHTSKNAFFLANKNKTVLEVVQKAQDIYEGLPFFLKPGVLAKNTKNLKLDNGSRLKSDTTTKNSSIGDTTDLLYVDEFAHISNDIADDFWENVFPTVSKPKRSRIIITSTPNGRNKFYEIYKGAKDRINDFHPFRVDWWQVPGHDEEWKQSEINNFGGGEKGRRAFNQQYGCQFIASNTLLLDEQMLNEIEKNKTDYVYREIDHLVEMGINHEKLKWNPKFNFNNLHSSRYIFSIDLSEGVGGDYSIINIFRIKLKKKYKQIKKTNKINEIYNYFALEQIGLFRCNYTSVKGVSEICYELMFNFFDPENVRIILEYNVFGTNFIDNYYTFYGEANLVDENYFIKYKHTKNAKFSKIGLKLRRDNKPIMCGDFKELVEDGYIELNEFETFEEACGFGRNKKGNYEGQLGHDDILMSSINASTIFKKLEFKELIEDYFDTLPDEQREYILNALDINTESINGDVYDALDFGETRHKNKLGRDINSLDLDIF